MGRYSHSKIDCASKCPRRYDYQYNQDLQPLEDSIHLTVGKLFHAAIENEAKFIDSKDIYDEFNSMVRKGMLKTCSEGTLERVVKEYLKYYYDEDSNDEIIYIEEKFEHLTADYDVLSGMYDRVYNRADSIYIRDIKTTLNKIKYTHADVVLNKQLNLYGYTLVHNYQTMPDFVEIDEVMIHDIHQVPMLSTGKPTRDTRQLAYVLYDDYYDVLVNLGLETNKDYQIALDYLKKRGHPLFNRVTVPFVYSVSKNVYDQEYMGTIKLIKSEVAFRNVGPLCNYCPFQDICKLELIGDEEDLVKELKANNYKPSDK